MPSKKKLKKKELEEIQEGDEKRIQAERDLLKKRLEDALYRYEKACELIKLALKHDPRSWMRRQIFSFWEQSPMKVDDFIVKFSTASSSFSNNPLSSPTSPNLFEPFKSFIIERLRKMAYADNNIEKSQLEEFMERTAEEINQMVYTLDSIESEYEEIKEKLTKI